MRAYFVGAACFAALAIAGCSSKSPTSIARIEGAEPQRLAFGDPKIVQKAFTDKMDRCWFNGSGALLAGYRYEVASAILDSGDRQGQIQQVIVRDGSRADTFFIVQFNPFNDNTLISTRSQSFPPQFAAQMKADVETWALEREACSGSQDVAARNGAAPASVAGPPPSRWW